VPQEQGETNGVFRFLATVVPNAGQQSCFYRMFGGAPPPDMVRVQGGSLPDTGNGAITVSSFTIGRYEVTWAEWQTVRDWAAANGYDIGSVGAGSATNHPVQTVNWYDCVKWCNARSQKEGRMPVYYTDEGLTLVYKTTDVLYPFVNAAATGYRLPTDAEWEFAARGGTRSLGYEYSGGNDLNTVGWYWDNTWGATVDQYEGHGTWPVGTKVANELGLYDMSGNVWEWSFDWYPEYEGSFRVLRGGSWFYTAVNCSSAFRNNDTPSGRYNYNGVRVILATGQQ
jgi:formylglycine-generating enzyme